MRNAYLKALHELAEKDKNVYAMISDNGAIVYDKYRADFPGQYLNLGISEANMLGMAAGMANTGCIPFAYTIGAFLAYRSLEFIRNDICLQRMNVKVVGIGAGEVYSALGATHHTTEDLGALRSLPNLVILNPCDGKEAYKATMAAYDYNGPVYLRLGTNGEPTVYEGDCPFSIGKANILKEGNDITIISTGSILRDVLDVAENLTSEGINIRVVDMHTIKPLDEEIILDSMSKTKGIVTVEDHNVTGGLGSAVAEVIAESGRSIPFKRVGLKTFSEEYGTYKELKEMNGVGTNNIIDAVKEVLNG